MDETLEFKTLAEKTLGDGTTLKLHEYALDATGADELRRPIGSLERVLELARDSVPLGCTDPSASWEIGKDAYLALFEGINSESEFYLIYQVLAKRGELASKRLYRNPFEFSATPENV